MTAENRNQVVRLVEPERPANFHSQLIDAARRHGQQLLAESKLPQQVSAAVQEFVLQRDTSLHIIASKTAPFDVFVDIDGVISAVFVDEVSRHTHAFTLLHMAFLVEGQR